MKLFTKEIDNKLFEQYKMGSDLESQKVVAKIFNPYGRGTWYLLNSDPQDPDYIWAIVDFFEVEMGSVSRRELEGIKVPPFGLGLERDMSFTPINAKELFEGLLNGEHYKDGGIMLDKDFTAIEKEYKENEDNNAHSENVVLLAENFGTEEEKAEAKEILEKHNEEGSLSSELRNRRSVLEEKLWDKYQALKKIYANGGQTTLFGDGGNVAEQNKEMLKNQAKEFMHHSQELNKLVENVKEVDAWVVAKAERASTDLSDITHYLEGRMAKGGMMEKGGKMNDEEGIDLFEDYENIPPKVQKILDKYEDDFINGDYQGTTKALKELEKIGYTFEFYLDGVAYDLRPIGTKGKSEFNNDFDFAKGGELVPYIVWTSKDGDKREFFGEFKSQRSAKIKADKLWETGEYEAIGYKQKSSYEKEGLYEDGGMMAKGGDLLKQDDYVWNAVGTKLRVDEVTDDEYYFVYFGSISPKPFKKEKVNEYIKTGQWTLKAPKMAKGGIIAYSDGDYEQKIGTFKSMASAKKFAKENNRKYETILFEDEYGDNIVVSKEDESEDIDWLFSDVMAKGGMMGVEGISNFGKTKGFDSYESKGIYDNRGLALKPTSDLKTLGSKLLIKQAENKMFYWCLVLENGKIYKKSESLFNTSQDAINDYMKQSFSKGGMLKAILVHKEFGVEYYKNGNLIQPSKEEKLKWELYGLPNDIKKIEQSFETTIDEFVGKTKKEIQSKSDEKIRSGKYNYLGTNPNLNLIFDDKMEMGGATFDDKVNAISKRLEGTKVPTRLKKDYGATYDKKEAKQAGQRIAGSMIKKLKMKMKNK
jgi:hypothetical protein